MTVWIPILYSRKSSFTLNLITAIILAIIELDEGNVVSSCLSQLIYVGESNLRLGSRERPVIRFNNFSFQWKCQ